RKLIGKNGFFRFYSGLTKTSTALPRLSSKRTIL
ncbi:AzlC family protein, partial [Neisseria meningitidis]